MLKINAALLILMLAFIPTHLSAEPFNCGKSWNSFTDSEKVIFLWGYEVCERNAIEFAREAFFPDSLTTKGQQQMNQFEKAVSLKFEAGTLKEVINSIYSDPANCFIDFSNAIFLAKSKLSGKDIENNIIEFRKEAIEIDTYKENNK
jgi:hypothetical protein